MLYTEQYRTKCAAKNPGDQSGPRRKRVDSMQISSWSSSSHASSSVRLPRQQKLTPAEAHSSRSTLQQKKPPPPWKECVCAHGDRVRRQKPRPPTRATRHAQGQAQANRLMTYYGYAGRYPWQCGQRLCLSALADTATLWAGSREVGDTFCAVETMTWCCKHGA